MPLILHIDTATENATISIAEHEQVLDFDTNTSQKDHASFLQPAIKQLLQKNNILIHQLNAIAVTAGPGSYTGLRVAMATAKGICYALKIPFITLSTLEVMGFSAITNTTETGSYFYCPMIDARRMEVFTALYDEHLKEIITPSALILQPDSFSDCLQLRQIIFFGNGAKKFLSLSDHSNIIYKETLNCVPALVFLALQKFQQNAFADLVTAEPHYIKQFYTISKLTKT